MPDQRIMYLDTLKELKKATHDLTDIIGSIRSMASVIVSYDRILLPDEDTPFSPQAFSGEQAFKVLEKDWPTFEEFKNALETWREVRRQAENAYARVSKEDAEGLDTLPMLPSRR